jgi:hypothetical protein
MHRLLIGLEQLDLPEAEKKRLTEMLPSAVYDFWRNGDHGLKHSKTVYLTAKKYLSLCPILRAECLKQYEREATIDALLTWAALLHDFGRFFGTGYRTLEEHQLFGAQLASACFKQDLEPGIVIGLRAMIERHDYICPFVDHVDFPILFYSFPLAEIFRLADKTSLPPAAELERYYETGKRLEGIFFHSHLTDDLRFSFDRSKLDDWDMLNYFLILFCIQPSDWFFEETRNLYQQWEKAAGGKKQAIIRLSQWARREGLSVDQLQQFGRILMNFFDHFHLPHP